jgi:Tol biopolymer transport system component
VSSGVALPSSLAPSTRLGPYEITVPLGAGGMGEVYRARDTRLDRDVALKLLPPRLAGDAEFRARFDREARSISSLNHPHICTLHDVGSALVDGRELHYLVMELIEGESLARRLDKGRLPLEDVLRLGAQIASALDAAHRRGIVHRDLKPGNVMVTRSGAKLLDFGLARQDDARAVVPALETRTGYDPESRDTLTERGTVLGTFQYMAPEQLEGRTADARTDIFALGAVLYEMATGRKAFEGRNRTSLIAAIVSHHPPAISSLQAMSPPALDHVVRKCLEKDADDRWQSARDVMAQLDWIAGGGSGAGLPGIVSARRRVREGAAWAIGALATLAAIGFGVLWTRQVSERPALMRFQIANPPGVTEVGPPVISPNGRTLAFDAVDASGQRSLWIRPLDALESRRLAGTEGAIRPIWSPDSQHIAFFGNGKLKRLPVGGGPMQTIADVPIGADGSWGPNGVILFDARTTDPLMRVDAAGGEPRPEVTPDPSIGGIGAGYPAFLPGGTYFLYYSLSDKPEMNALMVRALDGTESRLVMKTPSQVVFAPPHYLLFVRDRALVAQKFDPARRELEGEPVPVGEGLELDFVGLASVSASSNGVLAYRTGQATRRRLVFRDRSGKEAPAMEEEAEYLNTWLSPDGRRLVYDLTETGDVGDIWIRDMERGTRTRFTYEPEREFAPIGSPDGRRIVYTVQRKVWDLFVKDAAGGTDAELLLETGEDKYATDWTKDGTIVFQSRTEETVWDIWALPENGKGKPFPLRKTKFAEGSATVSPDGRFLLYQSTESGRAEIYVQEFPQARSKWQVSATGGRDPFWRGDGREIFYRSPTGDLMAVTVVKGASFEMGTPQALFRGRFVAANARSAYRPTPDGKRFLMLAPPADEALKPATIVLNWTSGLP